MAYYHLVIFAAFLTITTAKVAHFINCEKVSPVVCTVSEVRMDPCQGKNHCSFKRGINASLSFDFTPNFSASKLKTMVYWVAGRDVQFPYMDDDNGCSFTTCPLEAGKAQALDYTLNIGKKLPFGIFEFKWKVWNEADITQQCCFLTTVQIKKH